ncbi:hypothetical protein FSARC_2850 [Fusarium sarcochroum]|uniref:Uncharacterized protein n=1 Tax=Fusarium sarcochroum TaxID=1208366 RepID=A0A8H4U5A8_9HYPO|nr:hypothetical protein FSARC_2850 [Fusarium sarcochroum]
MDSSEQASSTYEAGDTSLNHSSKGTPARADSTTFSSSNILSRNHPGEVDALKASLKIFRTDVENDYQKLERKWMQTFGLSEEDLDDEPSPETPRVISNHRVTRAHSRSSYSPQRMPNGSSVTANSGNAGTVDQPGNTRAPSATRVLQVIPQKRPSQHVDIEQVKAMIRETRHGHRKVIKKFGQYDGKLARLSAYQKLVGHSASLAIERDAGGSSHSERGTTTRGASINESIQETRQMNSSSVLDTSQPQTAVSVSQERGEANSQSHPPANDRITAPNTPSSPIPDQRNTSTLHQQNPTFTIKVEDMGKNLPHTIQKLTGQDGFDNMVTIKDDRGHLEVPWEEIRESFQPSGHFCDYPMRARNNGRRMSTGRHGEDLSFCERKRADYLECPSCPDEVARPSDSEAAEFLNNSIHNPPTNNPQSYNGEPIDQRYDHLLFSGDQIQGYGSLVVGTCRPYWHLGARGSCTPLSRPWFAFWSYHLVLAGWTLWIMIDKRDNHKLHEFLNQVSPMPPARLATALEGLSRDTSSNEASNRLLCDGRINHAHVLISPQQLNKHGIRFEIRCIGAGEMMITRPNEYFLRLNFTSSLTISQLFLLPGETPWPRKSITCDRCLPSSTLAIPGHQRICYVDSEQMSTDERRMTSVNIEGQLQNRRKHRSKPSNNFTTGYEPGRITRMVTDLEQVERDILKIDPKCKIPDYQQHKPKASILHLATLIWSRPALVQFIELVGA